MSDFPTLFSSDEIDEHTPAHEVVRKVEQRELKKLCTFDEAKEIVTSNYPKVMDKINLIWGYPECELELDRLIVSNRSNRQGFPREVLEAIVAIHFEHQRLFGAFKKVDPWDTVFLK